MDKLDKLIRVAIDLMMVDQDYLNSCAEKSAQEFIQHLPDKVLPGLADACRHWINKWADEGWRDIGDLVEAAGCAACETDNIRQICLAVYQAIKGPMEAFEAYPFIEVMMECVLADLPSTGPKEVVS